MDRCCVGLGVVRGERGVGVVGNVCGRCVDGGWVIVEVRSGVIEGDIGYFDFDDVFGGVVFGWVVLVGGGDCYCRLIGELGGGYVGR